MNFILDTIQFVIILLVLSWIVYEIIQKVKESKDSSMFPGLERESINKDSSYLPEAALENVRDMLEMIGENPHRVGLLDTPKRVAKMWKEMFRGYDESQKPAITWFPNGQDGLTYDQMVIDQGYFYSQCEHHMVPFFGSYYFAYVPNKRVVGLSKVARIIDFYSAKLQVQERLVKEVLDALESELKPKGIALVMKGRHLCKEMRGAKKHAGEMITSDVRGVFRKDLAAREEFIRFINGK